MGRRWIKFQLLSLVIALASVPFLWTPHIPAGAQAWLIVPFWIAICPIMFYRAFPSRDEELSSVAQASRATENLRTLRALLAGTILVQLLNVSLVVLNIMEWRTAGPVLGACAAVQAGATVWFVLRSRKEPAP
jgi:hypothetical protein